MEIPNLFGQIISRLVIRKWITRDGLRALMAAAPRPELEQSLLRVAIPFLAALWLLGDLVFTGDLASGEWHGLAVALGFLTFALALTIHILATGDRKPRVTVARSFLGISADNAVNTYFMLVMGEGGAVVVGVYLFVTFGNGFRFGRLYLHVSQALSLIGFSIVLFFSPFWSHHLAVGSGFLVAMVVLPFYVGVLAERITEAKRGRMGERSKRTVPRERQPRDAHAAERRNRDDRLVARNATRRVATGNRRNAFDFGATGPGADRGNSRCSEDRGGQGTAGSAAVRPRQAADRRGQGHPAASTIQGPGRQYG